MNDYICECDVILFNCVLDVIILILRKGPPFPLSRSEVSKNQKKEVGEHQALNESWRKNRCAIHPHRGQYLHVYMYVGSVVWVR